MLGALNEAKLPLGGTNATGAHGTKLSELHSEFNHHKSENSKRNAATMTADLLKKITYDRGDTLRAPGSLDSLQAYAETNNSGSISQDSPNMSREASPSEEINKIIETTILLW